MKMIGTAVCPTCNQRFDVAVQQKKSYEPDPKPTVTQKRGRRGFGATRKPKKGKK